MFWLAEVFNGSFSADELRRHEQWARRQRAETIQKLFSATGRGFARAASAAAVGLAAVYRKHRRWRRKRAAIRELGGLSDQILKDIGMTRGDIRPVVEGMLDGRQEARSAFRVFRAPRQENAAVSGSSADQPEDAGNWQKAA